MRDKTCHVCKGTIRIFYDHEPGDLVYCQDCQREFEIRSLSPMVLEPLAPYEVQEAPLSWIA